MQGLPEAELLVSLVLHQNEGGTLPGLFYAMNTKARKLCEADVHLIRELRARYGTSYREIAAKFEVSAMSAWRTVNGVSWKRVGR